MILEFKNLHKSYTDNHVLKGLNFKVESGRPLAFLGRNGAGKTTMIRTLMGVIHKDEGEILLDGKPFRPDDYKIGYLPEERGMYQKSGILEQLVYFGELKGMTRKAALESGQYLLDRVGLADYAKQKLEVLSKGNQQKVQLAQTLLGNPDIIIMDEPFSGLDPINSKLLMDLILEQKDGDKLMLFSSHQMSYVEEICDDLAILNRGTVAVTGSIAELQRELSEGMIFIVPKDAGLEEFQAKLDAAGYTTRLDQRKERILVDLSESSQEEFLIQASNLGITIDSYGLLKPTLSDIFLHYAE